MKIYNFHLGRRCDPTGRVKSSKRICYLFILNLNFCSFWTISSLCCKSPQQRNRSGVCVWGNLDICRKTFIIQFHFASFIMILHDCLAVKNNSNKTSTCTHSNLKFLVSKICVEIIKNVLFVILTVMENSRLTADRRRTKHLSSSQTVVAKEKGFSLPRIQRYTCTCNYTSCASVCSQ